jgi:hypothetical protein
MPIKKGSLSDYFAGFGVKRLSAVEINSKVSNQHEFQGVKAFRELFGIKKAEFQAKILYFSEIDDEIIEEETTLTWYDARENQPLRSPEYRLYYKESAVTRLGSERDLLFVGKKQDGSVVVIIAVENSTFENQLLWLFGLDRRSIGDEFTVRKVEGAGRLDYVSKIILDKIGIELEESDDTRLSMIESRFGKEFPKSVIFSEFARSFSKGLDILENPDAALVTWLNEEELLFRMLEKIIVAQKLEKGFKNVDDFISFSLSVQNRRKSRAGYALENHFRFIFDEAHIRYDYNKVTENKSRPDFIFPGVKEYHDSKFPVINLTMLGVKTTCKDRWRQVLSEADRIDRKHLFTLEPGISENQTAEMIERALQLVVPASVFSTFTAKQQKWLIGLKEFMGMVKAKQK